MAFEVGTIGTARTVADEQGAKPVRRIAARLRLATWIGLTTDCFSAASGVFVAMPFETDGPASAPQPQRGEPEEPSGGRPSA